MASEFRLTQEDFNPLNDVCWVICYGPDEWY